MKKKHRNPFISRLLAMCLAAVMMLSMGITASAALPDNLQGDFTVSGFDTTLAPTVTAYQIITVNIDDDTKEPEYPAYTWAKPVAQWLMDNNYDNYIDNELGENAVADAFAKDTVLAAEMTKFLEELAAAIKGNSIIGLTSITGTVTNGTASFNAPLGEYLIIASGGVKIYQPTTVKLVPEYKNSQWNVVIGGKEVATDGSIVVKGSAPQIDKTVFKNGSGDTADRTTAVGDTVTFKLAADVPEYPEGATNKMFIISDKVGTGLEYVDDSVKVYNDVNCTTEIGEALRTITDTDVTVPNQSGEPRTFKIEFNDGFFGQDTVPPKVYVTYEAKVTADAFIGTTGGKLDNDAFLRYSNDPYVDNSYWEDTDRETLYTYKIDLTKVNTNGKEITNNTATFELKSGETTLSFTGSNGVYTHAAAGTQDAITALMTSTTDGTLKLQGLDEGTYTLIETNAPDGYVLPNGTITVEIEDADGTSGDPNGEIDMLNGENKNITATGGAEIYVAEGDPNAGVTITGTTISFNVVNKTAKEGLFNLPVTGGAGTVIFTMAGILLMGGAVALLVVVLRRKRS